MASVLQRPRIDRAIASRDGRTREGDLGVDTYLPGMTLDLEDRTQLGSRRSGVPGAAANEKNWW